jgi:NTP pyrophosphatase (non-canonical NTP hydrolase)
MALYCLCPNCGQIMETRTDGYYCPDCEKKKRKIYNPINLPTIDYSDWTIPQQVRKIGEEYGEVAEALLEGNPVEVIRESLDCMQTHWTLINMVAKEYGINIDKLYQEHCQKLVRKGYVKEG